MVICAGTPCENGRRPPGVTVVIVVTPGVVVVVVVVVVVAGVAVSNDACQLVAEKKVALPSATIGCPLPFKLFASSAVAMSF